VLKEDLYILFFLWLSRGKEKEGNIWIKRISFNTNDNHLSYIDYIPKWIESILNLYKLFSFLFFLLRISINRFSLLFGSMISLSGNYKTRTEILLSVNHTSQLISFFYIQIKQNKWVCFLHTPCSNIFFFNVNIYIFFFLVKEKK